MTHLATQIERGGAHPQTLRTTPEPRLNRGGIATMSLRSLRMTKVNNRDRWIGHAAPPLRTMEGFPPAIGASNSISSTAIGRSTAASR